MKPRPPCSTLFPYTTLFRSGAEGAPQRAPVAGGRGGRVGRGLADGAARRAAVDRAGAGVLVRVVRARSEEHTSELQSRRDLVCRLLLEKKNDNYGWKGRKSC